MTDLEKAVNLLEQGLWDEAHELVQEGNNKYFFLIHGLLHRIEGDLPNAQYWYRRASESLLDNSTEAEIMRLKSMIKDA